MSHIDETPTSPIALTNVWNDQVLYTPEPAHEDPSRTRLSNRLISAIALSCKLRFTPRPVHGVPAVQANELVIDDPLNLYRV